MSDEEKQLQQALDDLMQMRDSRGWQIMIRQLRRQKAAAIEELVHVPPENTPRIAELQNEVRKYDEMIMLPEQLMASVRTEEEMAELMAEDEPGEFNLEEEFYDGSESYH